MLNRNVVQATRVYTRLMNNGLSTKQARNAIDYSDFDRQFDAGEWSDAITSRNEQNRSYEMGLLVEKRLHVSMQDVEEAFHVFEAIYHSVLMGETVVTV